MDTLNLDAVFSALSDPTRRSILMRLTEGPATVTELARPFRMSLPAVSKHLKVLERAGLLSRSIEGRIHRCSVRKGTLEAAVEWIGRYQQLCDSVVSFAGDTVMPHVIVPPLGSMAVDGISPAPISADGMNGEGMNGDGMSGEGIIGDGVEASAASHGR